MAPVKFALVYRDEEHVNHENSITVLASTINAGIRKAVSQATASDSHPPGWQLISVHWEPVVE